MKRPACNSFHPVSILDDFSPFPVSYSPGLECRNGSKVEGAMTNIDPTYRQLILQAMVSMASADGEIDADETATIHSVYSKETGADISTEDVTQAAERLHSDSGRLSDELKAANATMDVAAKEALLRASYLVLLADGRVASRERKKLMDFARALKIPEIHLSVILEDVSG